MVAAKMSMLLSIQPLSGVSPGTMLPAWEEKMAVAPSSVIAASAATAVITVRARLGLPDPEDPRHPARRGPHTLGPTQSRPK